MVKARAFKTNLNLHAAAFLTSATGHFAKLLANSPPQLVKWDLSFALHSPSTPKIYKKGNGGWIGAPRARHRTFCFCSALDDLCRRIIFDTSCPALPHPVHSTRGHTFGSGAAVSEAQSPRVCLGISVCQGPQTGNQKAAIDVSSCPLDRMAPEA